MSEKLLSTIAEAVRNLQHQQAERLVREALDGGLSPERILDQAVVVGMREVGELYEQRKAFLLELQLVGELADDLIAMMLPFMTRNRGTAEKRQGKVLLATVFGDLHDIGKKLVGIELQMAGYQVLDIGLNQPSSEIIRSAEDTGADVIALSSLLLITMPQQAEVIRQLAEMGLRHKYRVLVGGGPTSSQWARRIGADSWAPNARKTVEEMAKLLSAPPASRKSI